MMGYLTDDICISAGLDYADSTAVREGAIVDLSGWDGIVAVTTTATYAASAVGDFHWEGGDDDALTDAADLEGTAIATTEASDNLLIVSDLQQPACRYVRGVITADTSNSQACSMLYITYRRRTGPTDSTDAGEVTVEQHGPGTGAGTK